MLTRKNGETNKQWADRCKAALDQVVENNRALRCLVNELNVANPRTNQTYKSEAELMFEALALMDHFYRNGNDEMAKMICEGVIHQMGFNSVEVATDVLIKPGIYNSKE